MTTHFQIVPKRIRAKLYLTGDSDGDLGPWVERFHRFIREHALPGIWVDVVDYVHVPRGPGALLVGHEADVAFGEQDGGLGLSWTRKRGHEDSLDDALAATLEGALRAAQASEAAGAPALDRSTLSLSFLDRLAAPRDRTDELCASARRAARRVLGRDVSVSVAVADARAPLRLQIS